MAPGLQGSSPPSVWGMQLQTANSAPSWGLLQVRRLPLPCRCRWFLPAVHCQGPAPCAAAAQPQVGQVRCQHLPQPGPPSPPVQRLERAGWVLCQWWAVAAGLQGGKQEALQMKQCLFWSYHKLFMVGRQEGKQAGEKCVLEWSALPRQLGTMPALLVVECLLHSLSKSL